MIEEPDKPVRIGGRIPVSLFSPRRIVMMVQWIKQVDHAWTVLAKVI